MVRRTTHVPGFEKLWLVRCPDPVSPSPKSQAQLLAVALEFAASKITLFVPLVIDGSVGENVNAATKSLDVVDTVIVREMVADCLKSFVAVNETVYVAAREYRCVEVTPEPVVPSP